MNLKKILVFILLAFLPMMGVGLIMKLWPDFVLVKALLSAAAMLIPLFAVVVTQLIFKETVMEGMGISFKFNKWWWIGWLLVPIIALAILGVSLLMPGMQWSTDNEAMQATLKQMPSGIGPWGLMAITLVSGLFAGITINAVFAFGEEIAWRGFLVKELKGKNFLTQCLIIGTVWGFWHFPIILNGHNYPDHRVAGVFMMVLMCLALTPILLYFRKKSGSVIVPAIIHGTFNGVVGISSIFVAPGNDLLTGAPGLAGIIVLLLVDLCLFLFDPQGTLFSKDAPADNGDPAQNLIQQG